MVENTVGSVLIAILSFSTGFGLSSIIANYTVSKRMDKLFQDKYDLATTSYQKGLFDGREAEHAAIEYSLTKVKSSGSDVYIAQQVDNSGTYVSAESMIAAGFVGYPNGYKLEAGETLESLEKKLRRS